MDFLDPVLFTKNFQKGRTQLWLARESMITIQHSPHNFRENQRQTDCYFPFCTVEARYNVVPNDWQSVFVTTGVRYKRNDEIAGKRPKLILDYDFQFEKSMESKAASCDYRTCPSATYDKLLKEAWSFAVECNGLKVLHIC